MAFEQEHTEELEQLQKQKENERIQQELDLAIARIENEQIQRDLDAAIERLDQQISQHEENTEEQVIDDQAPQLSASTEEELSSHESVTEEKSDQQNSLEQSLHTWDAELISQHEENNEEQQTQNHDLTKSEDIERDQEVELNLLQMREENKQFQQELNAIIERLDQQISQYEENTEGQVIGNQTSQQPSSVEEELSSNDSVMEEKLEQLYALESTQTFNNQITCDFQEMDVKDEEHAKIEQEHREQEGVIREDGQSEEKPTVTHQKTKSKQQIEHHVEILIINQKIEEKQTERDYNTSIRIVQNKYLEDQTESNQYKEDLILKKEIKEDNQQASDKFIHSELVKHKQEENQNVLHEEHFSQLFNPLTQITSLKHNRLTQYRHFWNNNLSNLQNKTNKSMRGFLESYKRTIDSVEGISFVYWSDKQKKSASMIVKSHKKELSGLLERSKLLAEFYEENSTKNHLLLIEDHNEENKFGKDLYFSSIKENNNLEGAIITTKYGVEIFSQNYSNIETSFQLLAEMNRSDKIDLIKVRSIKQQIVNDVFTDLLTKMDKKKQKRVIDALINLKLLNKDTYDGFDYFVHLYGEEGILSIENINYPCPSKGSSFLSKKNISYQYLPGGTKSILSRAGPQHLMMWKKSGDWIRENWLLIPDIGKAKIGEKVKISPEDSRVRKIELELLDDDKLRVYIWGRGTGRNKDRRKNAIRYITDRDGAGIGYYKEHTRIRRDRGGRTESSVQLGGLDRGKKVSYFKHFFTRDKAYKTGQSIIIDTKKYFEFLNEIDNEITRISVLMELRQKGAITGKELRTIDDSFSQNFHKIARGGWWAEYTEHGSWNGILEDDKVYQFYNKQLHPFSIANIIDIISKEILDTEIIHKKSITSDVIIKELLKNYERRSGYFPSNRKASKLILSPKSELKRLSTLKSKNGRVIKVEQCISGQGGTIVSGRDILQLKNEKKGATTVFSNSLANTTGRNKKYFINGENHPLHTILGLDHEQINEGRYSISRKYDDARIKKYFDILAPDVVIIDNKSGDINGINQVKGKTANNEGFLANSTIIQLIELDLVQRIAKVKVAFVEINEIKIRKDDRKVIYNWVTFKQDGKIELYKLNDLMLRNLIVRETRHADFIRKVYSDVIMSANQRSEHVQLLERVLKNNKDFVFQRTESVVRNFDNFYKTSLSNTYSFELFDQIYTEITDQLLAMNTITKTKRLAGKTGLLEYPSFKYNFQKRVMADWWIPYISEFYE